MRLPLTRSENIVLTIIIIHLTLSRVCRTCRLHSEFIRLLFLQAQRESDRFFAASGVQLAQTHRDMFHFHRAAFSSLLKVKCGNILAKASALRVNLNLDGAPITSNSHTHPSHPQNSRLLTSSLSLGVPVPRTPSVCETCRSLSFRF